MSGHLDNGERCPLVSFFLKGIFKNVIGMDYDRGPIMLKSKVETGHVNSTLKLTGLRQQPAQHYVGIKGAATTAELGPIMQDHLHQIETLVESSTLKPDGPMFALYESMSMNTGVFDFHTCCPVSDPIKLPPPFVSGTITAGQSYVITHS